MRRENEELGTSVLRAVQGQRGNRVYTEKVSGGLKSHRVCTLCMCPVKGLFFTKLIQPRYLFYRVIIMPQKVHKMALRTHPAFPLHEPLSEAAAF